MFADAFSYPFEGDDAMETLLIGSGIVFGYGLLYLVATLLTFVFVGFLLYPLLLVPLILLYGYMMAVIATTVEGATEPPVFDDWKALGMQGVRMFAIVLIYQLPLFVFVVLFGITFVAIAGVDPAAAEQASNQMTTLLMLAFVLVVGVVGLGLTYIIPAGLCSAAQDRSLTAAFSVERLKGACLSSEYAIAWLLAGAVYLFITTIGVVLSIILVGIPIVFYSIVVMARLLGIGYREGLSIEPPEDGTDGSDGSEERAKTDEASTGEATPATGQPAETPSGGTGDEATDHADDDGRAERSRDRDDSLFEASGADG
jgi:hypothetical protein